MSMAALYLNSVILILPLLFHASQVHSFAPMVSLSSTPVTTIRSAASDLDFNFDKRNDDDITNTNDDDDDELELPWGKSQEWALRDNLPNYTVHIPKLKTNTNNNGGTSYAMWRSMARDVVELSGYDVQFLQKMHKKQLQRSNDEKMDMETPGILPMIDRFTFRPNGGLSGNIRGLAGISDGTTVQTSPLSHVELTLPRGYVLTKDYTMAYELGVPLNEEEEGYDMDYAKYATTSIEDILDKGKMVDVAKGATREVVDVLKDEETGRMLTNVGASTAIVLGSAVAFNLLSHHLTVNVFWV